MSGWRYIAVDALTGEILDGDLEMTALGRTRELSGPGSLVLTAEPDVGALRTESGRLVLGEWSTIIYAEHDDIIRWGGIVQRARFDGPLLRVEAAGLSSYPHGMPFLDELIGTNLDPADVTRRIWQHIQSFAEGNLRVQVVGTTTARVGTETKEEVVRDADGKAQKDAAGNDVTRQVPVPYELVWWDSPDCGREVDRLTDEGAFEWVEDIRWADASKTAISHVIRIADTVGTRRNDLRFVQGENVIASSPMTFGDEDYASAVHMVGAGEGAGSVRAHAAVATNGRLRRATTIPMKGVADKARLGALARDEVTFRSRLGSELESITVIHHHNAPLESWGLGDVIVIELVAPWVGETHTTARIVAYTIDDQAGTAELTLAPAG